MMFVHLDEISQYVFDEKKYWKFTKDQYECFVLKERSDKESPYRNEPVLITLDKTAKTISRVWYDGFKDFEPFIGVS